MSYFTKCSIPFIKAKTKSDGTVTIKNLPVNLALCAAIEKQEKNAKGSIERFPKIIFYRVDNYCHSWAYKNKSDRDRDYELLTKDISHKE